MPHLGHIEALMIHTALQSGVRSEAGELYNQKRYPSRSDCISLMLQPFY